MPDRSIKLTEQADSAPLISLRGVGKNYPLMTSGGDRLRTLASLIMGRHAHSEFAALKDIDFDVCRGQSLGLIGENGAGKSTLLKIVAGVVKPSAGVVTANGKIGALLELGAGFHPEYTGRENIFLAAALTGMSRPDVARRVDEILAFADIGSHIDQPIKHYSSGMVVRLGFAIATTMAPDILITDEVLAVGDESFQKKCIAWMEAYLSRGGTLLLCSHSMFHIQKLCDKSIWIHHGQAHAFGPAADVTREYLAYHEEKTRQARAPLAAEAAEAVPAGGSDIYQIRSLSINRVPGDVPVTMAMGETLLVSGTVHSPDGRTPNVAIGLVRADGTGVYGVMSDMDNFSPRILPNGLFSFAIRYPGLALLPGRYHVRSHAMDPEGLRMFDHVERVLNVTGNSRELGMCRLEHEWFFSDEESAISICTEPSASPVRPAAECRAGVAR